MNTRIAYLYRDGANNKRLAEPVLAGVLTPQQIRDIQHVCDEETFFIASQVGLPDLQTQWAANGYAFPTDNDHVWSELQAITNTEDAPTRALTADAFYTAMIATATWDISGAMERLGIA